jgi:long-chain acyl-CoA synthetase
MMAGYLNFETLQPEPASEWFPSGDLGRLGPEGHLFITGRRKDLIIRAGTNISPRAVEEVLQEHPAVAAVAVVGLPHPVYGEEVAAAVALKPGQSMEDVRPRLMALCRERLSPAAWPSRITALAEMPLGKTGKILKDRVRELLAPDPAPRT